MAANVSHTTRSHATKVAGVPPVGLAPSLLVIATTGIRRLRGAATKRCASPDRPTHSAGTAPGAPEYRPHIDGLRAIAVLSVVLYHLGFGVLPGGFAGVDIFFVISGYLISRMIFRELLTGTFSLVGFYERRARRILPAFFVISLAIGVGVYLISFPTDLYRFGKSLLAAIFFVPNIHSYLTSNYFAPAAETLPLLHYWSLGVEEQFYIIFPLIIIAVVRFARRWLAPIILALAVASLLHPNSCSALTRRRLSISCRSERSNCSSALVSRCRARSIRGDDLSHW